MPAPNPEALILSDTPPNIYDTYLDSTEADYIKIYHRERRRKIIAKTAVAASLFLGWNAYWIDVMHNTAVESQTEPSLKVIAQPLDPANRDSANFVFNGFNTVNANYYAKINAEAIQQNGDGYVVSVQYNNASFEGTLLSEPVKEFIEEHDIETAHYTFISAGNIPGTKVAADIEQTLNVSLGTSQHYMSPSGANGVKAFRQSEMQFAQLASKFIAGSPNSTFWRIAVEQYFYNDEYTKGEYTSDLLHNIGLTLENTHRFFKVGAGILERFNNGDYTSNNFLLKQIDAINNADLEENYKIIGEASDAIIYWRGSRDDIVDQDISAKDICAYVNKAGAACLEYEIPNASHVAYWETTEEFKSAASYVAQVMPQEIQAFQFSRNNPLSPENIFSGEYFANLKTSQQVLSDATDYSITQEPLNR